MWTSRIIQTLPLLVHIVCKYDFKKLWPLCEMQTRTKNGRPKREVTLSLLWLLMEKVMILKESK